MKRFYIFILVLLFIGCDRSADPSDSLTTTSTNYSGGEVKFDIISRTNTLKDVEGNFRDSGHYSLIYQAKVSKNDMPLSGLNDNSFYTMFENGKHINESKLQVTQDSKTVSNKILLLLDFSGSIISDCNDINATEDSSNLCYQIVTSSKKFIDTIVSENQTMSIYYFNNHTKPIPLSNNSDTTDDKELLKSSLDNLYNSSWRDTHLKGFDSTNLYGAIKVAADEIVCDWFQDCIRGKSSELDNNKKHYDFATIVVFTDGRHTVGNNVSESELLSTLSLYKRNYYYTIGLGDDIDDEVLKEIGKDGFLKASQTDKLDIEFDKLGERLNNFANSFYRIDYCPAQQTGRLDLLIDVDDNVRKFYGEIKDSIDLIDKHDFRCDL